MTDLSNAITKRARKVALMITLDDLKALPPYTGRYLIQGDNGKHAKIVTVALEGGKVVGYARWETTDMLLRFEQTGRGVGKGDWGIRVKLLGSDDTGDLAGTLSFERPIGGGWFNKDLLREL